MNSAERCPWCGTEISRAKFEDITARIRADEQRKAQAQELLIRQRLEEDHDVELKSEKKKALSAGKDEAQKALKPQLDGLQKALQEAKEAGETLKSRPSFHRCLVRSCRVR